MRVEVVVGFAWLVAALGCREKSHHTESKEEAKDTRGASTEPTKDPRTAHGVWWSHGPICVTDVNGDGKGDVVGITSANGLTVIAIDGVTGHVVWTLPVGDANDVLCAGESGVFVARERFLVSHLDSATGAQRWETKLPDSMLELAAGHDCVVLKARNDAETKLATATGGPLATCLTTAKMPTPMSQRRARGAGYAAGDVVMRVDDSPSPGTSRAVVSALKGKTTLWSKTLDVWTFPQLAIAPTSDGVFVSGTPPEDQGHLVWTFVRANGDVAYRHEEPTSSVAAADEAIADGGRVFLKAIGRMYAIDVQTGNVLWWLGHE